MAKSNLKLRVNHKVDDKKVDDKVNYSEKSIGQYQQEIVFTKEINILSKRVRIHEEIGYFKSIRIPLKIVVCEMDSNHTNSNRINSNRITLVSTDLKMSGKEILKRYMSRWKIEVFFKTAKQRFNLKDCTLRNEKGQKHWMVIVGISYLIFKIIKRLLMMKSSQRTKEQITNDQEINNHEIKNQEINDQRIEDIIHLAVSYMISMTKEAKEAYFRLNHNTDRNYSYNQALFLGFIDIGLIT